MDGLGPNGKPLAAPISRRFDDASRAFNRYALASHRQNFLVPPRQHRSFPLGELLA